MKSVFIIAMVFFISVTIALHFVLLKMHGKPISKKEWNRSRFFHWNWLLLIGGLSTVLFVGILKWMGIVPLT